jgi:hypothetical protein
MTSSTATSGSSLPTFSLSVPYSSITATTTTSSTLTMSVAAGYTVVADAATGPLCAGKQISTPPYNLGAYNYQRVQVGAYVYEIECYVTFNSDGSVGLFNTLELCIAYCNNLNSGNNFGCYGVTFDSISGNCYPGISGPFTTPQIPFGFTIQSARLVVSNDQLITDELWLLPTPTADNLGLTQATYAMAYIAPQYTDGTYSTAYMYEAEVGQAYDYSTNTNLTSTASTYYQNMLNGAPQSVDDCLRICNWINHQTGVQCNFYAFDSTSLSCTCTNGALGTYMMLAGGGKLLGTITDRPAGYGYKKREEMVVTKRNLAKKKRNPVVKIRGLSGPDRPRYF